jgi:hypothetical protein
VYSDYLKGKFSLADTFVDPAGVTAEGLEAHSADEGYRDDGSRRFGTFLKDTSAQANMVESMEAMAVQVSDTWGDGYGSSILPSSLDKLGTYLAYCKSQHICVVGFMPPIPQAVYDKMQKYPNAQYAKSFNTLAPTLAAIYHKYGFEFFDTTQESTFGSSDAERADGGHGSEKMMAKLFVYVAKRSPELGAYVDIPRLEQEIASSTSDFYVFDNQTLKLSLKSHSKNGRVS